MRTLFFAIPEEKHPENVHLADGVKSKAEIIDNIPQDLHGNYYIFGGWYGVLAHLLNDNIVADEIYSIDIDQTCKEIGDIYFRNQNLTYITADMKDYQYPKKPDVVINTSTEHVHQHSYSRKGPQGEFASSQSTSSSQHFERPVAL